MDKKFWTILSMALIFALVSGAIFTTPVAAQGEKPGKPDKSQKAQQAKKAQDPARNLILGQVTAINTADFTIQTRKGEARAFRINDSTRYYDEDRHEIDAAQFKVGAWVTVVAPQPGARLGGSARGGNRPLVNWLRQLLQKPDEKPLARTVIVLPEGFDPENMAEVRGDITAVSTAGFTITDKDGKVVTLAIDGETRFTGQAESLAELKQGMGVMAVTEQQPDGSLLARRVRAGYKLERRVGQVTAVNAASLTIKTLRDNESLTFEVTADTRFGSKDDTIHSLADIKTGMNVIVIGHSENGVLMAEVIAGGKVK